MFTIWCCGCQELFLCVRGKVSVERLALCGRYHAGHSLQECQNTEEDVFTAA